MQMLMHVRFPIDPFNASVRDGSIGKKMQKVLDAVKPSAAYFTAHDGQRGGTFVVNVNAPSELPRLAEPFFLTFHAKVHFEPFMTPEDLARSGLEALGKEWS
jgi:hypothetical protein